MRQALLFGLAFLLTACGSTDNGPTAGDITVFVASTGSELDPNGYVVKVVGGDSAQVAPQDTLTMTGVEPGLHEVRLTGSAANCTTVAPDTVEVVAGEVDTVAFNVSCYSTTATLKVTVATEGSAPDPDGYSVTIDGGASLHLGVNDTTGGLTVPVGDHTVVLDGVVSNCAPNTAGPYHVYLGPAVTQTVYIPITCALPRVLVEWKGGATGGIIAMNEDGSNPTMLLPDTGGIDYRDPSWAGAPGNTIFAFDFRRNGSPRGIGARLYGYTDLFTLLLEDDLDTRRPRWWYGFIDDEMAYLRPDSATGEDRVQILVHSGVTAQLTPDSLVATGVDDGKDFWVAFTAKGPDNAVRLYRIYGGGNGLSRLTPDSVTDASLPRLSPDGLTVAFVSQQSLHLISTAGTGLTKLPTPGYTPITPPSWSADGTRLLVGVIDQVTGGAKLLFVTTAGTIQGTLTAPTGTYLNPDWH